MLSFGPFCGETMCGIAAIFQLNKPLASAAPITKMTELIAHRGPDDEGYTFFPVNGGDPLTMGGLDTPKDAYCCQAVYSPKFCATSESWGPFLGAMGHRRLSIVDLSPYGHQPMCSQDQRVWITYNGEIYNFIEVRRELEKGGRKFQTSSDTEVIIQAWLQWGEECLHRFNGMFAFVLYDRRDNRVFAARDRFSVKPLYYWISPEGWIAFASEIKEFTVLRGWSPIWNSQRIYDYLIWGLTDHTDETLFHGVKQLRGGESLLFTPMIDPSKTLVPKVWYHLKQQPFVGTFEEASEQYLLLFRDAVRLRLRADVAVGSCLSGGLDSSSIVSLANELLDGSGNKQSTFSACSIIKKFDERPFMEDIVSRFGVHAHYTYPSVSTLFEDTDTLVWHQEEPFPSTSIFAQWHVFKLAKEKKIKVMLDGQGADEQLGGYYPYFGHRFFDLFASMQWVDLVKEMRLAKNNHNHLSPLSMLFNTIFPRYLRHKIKVSLKKSSLLPEWLDISRLGAELKDPLIHLKGQRFQDKSRMEICQERIPRLLHYEDRNSMAHSIESRTPFMDYRLVEFTFGLPSAFKISKGWTKRVLRKGMQGRLPESVRLRIDKLGFVTPEEVWLKKEQPEQFRKAILRTVDNSQGMIKRSIVQEVDGIINGTRPFSTIPWRVVSLGYWIDRFAVIPN